MTFIASLLHYLNVAIRFMQKRITNVINVIDVDGVFVLCRLCLDTGGGRVRPGELMSV